MLLFGLILAAAIGHRLPTDDRRLLLPFDYHGVTVTDGLLKNQMDEAKEFYLRIPNDDLLLGFRRRAGFPAPGHKLGGWYGDDVFHIFGQVLSGLARLYAATGDPACKNKADSLLDGWSSCIAPDGYFYYSLHPNAPHYIFDKMVGGLVDMAVYCRRTDAFAHLSKITDWAIKHLDRSHKFLDGGEWYTLSENLYRAYLVTGDSKYRDFAKVWEYTTYWSAYAEKRDIFAKQPDGNQTGRYHAYSHLNTLGGAALAYRVSGESKYLDTITRAFDFLQANEVFATGGFGPDESILPKPELAKRLETTGASFETQCGAWAVFKLCKNLIALTGDAKYGDWAEQVAYNGIGATIPMTPDGRVFYYSDYNSFGATKFNHGDDWSCCAGTRPMAIADVTDMTYFKAPDGLDVNLFIPSTVQLSADTEVIQHTRFPEVGSTEFEVRLKRPTRFTLRIRKPSWLASAASASLNGAPIELKSDSKSWLAVARTWSNGDRLSISLPMALRSVPLYANRPYPTALAVGPVVLACRTDGESPVDQVDLAHLGDVFMPSPGEPLTYHLRKNPSVLARPFYAFKEGEEYFLYLDPVALHNVPHNQMKRSGAWNRSERFFYANAPGAWIEGTFTGDSVKILGWAFDDGGQATVTVDGKPVGMLNQYGPGRDLPWEWKTSGLGPGKHTLRVTVAHEKSPDSKDYFVNVGGLEVP